MTAEAGPSDQPGAAGSPDVVAPRFPVVASTVVHQGLMMTLRVDRVDMPDGTAVDREVAQRPGAVAVVPLTSDGEVVLVRQYRHPVGRYELEIPAGLLDADDETEEEAAQRELSEEIGMAAGRLERLTRFWNSAGWSDEATTVFAGRDLYASAPDHEFTAQAEEADMAVLRMPLSSAIGKVRSEEITDAKTVIGLLLVAGDRSNGP